MYLKSNNVKPCVVVHGKTDKYRWWSVQWEQDKRNQVKQPSHATDSMKWNDRKKQNLLLAFFQALEYSVSLSLSLISFYHTCYIVQHNNILLIIIYYIFCHKYEAVIEIILQLFKNGYVRQTVVRQRNSCRIEREPRWRVIWAHHRHSGSRNNYPFAIRFHIICHLLIWKFLSRTNETRKKKLIKINVVFHCVCLLMCV